MERYFKRKSTLELSSPPKRDGTSSKRSCVEMNLTDLPKRDDDNSPKNSCVEINLTDLQKKDDNSSKNSCVEISLTDLQKRDDNSSKNSCLEISLIDLPKRDDNSSTKSCVEINLADLPVDPGQRIQISDYNPNVQDQVRIAYLRKGPCQPRNHTFPFKNFGQNSRRFNPAWFSEYPGWLEYSIAKDAAFCLCCYLFRPNMGKQAGGDSFVREGFSNWKKKERLQTHVGSRDSVHSHAWKKCVALLNQNQLYQVQSENEIGLGITYIDCIRLLLRLGIPFHGHHKFEDSSNIGNFLELLQWRCDRKNDVKAVTLETALQNSKLIEVDIQKQIVTAISIEIVNAIVRDIGDGFFSILIDGSDISLDEQITFVLRYVDKGHVIERYVGFERVTDATALSLKVIVDQFFSKHGLSLSRLRGQSYEGLSNMRCEFNGLKSLIMTENECAFYVPYFAHQLHSTLVAVAKNHVEITCFFTLVAKVVNVVGSSAKHYYFLREKLVLVVFEALYNSEFSTGKVSNQEINLTVMYGDARRVLNSNTLLSLITMFSSIIEVLEIIEEDGSSEDQYQAMFLLDSIQSFDFVFCLHLMKTLLGISSDLSQALQKRDHDIVNAMMLARICKEGLQIMRNSGWDSLFNQVSSFCVEHHIEVRNMDDMFLKRSRRRAHEIRNMHHYRIELFNAVIDMQLQELNNLFTETNTELLLCVACLNPSDSFSAFDKQKLIRLAQLYPKDFSTIELVHLEDQLENYIIGMRSNIEFSGLSGITDLAQKMVKTKKDKVCQLVYLLLTLALILPVAKATTERVFSAIKISKNQLRDQIGDEWMGASLIAYIEKNIFDSIDNEVIMQQFDNMKTR